MVVSQIGKTTTSVRIEVSGIPAEYSRETCIQIPKSISGEESSAFYTLSEARISGYIKDYNVSSFTENDGWVEIYMLPDWVDRFPLWRLRVRGKQGDTPMCSVIIDTALAFDYDGFYPKLSGMDIDITARDLNVVNRFGVYVDNWIGGNNSVVKNSGIVQGLPIYADFLRTPASQIYNHAQYGGNLAADIMAYTSDIIDNCTSGSDFKASYFNNIKWVIDNFMPSVSD